jgi:LEA14-like dessication related protein
MGWLLLAGLGSSQLLSGCAMFGGDTLPPEVRVESLVPVAGGRLEKRFAVRLVFENPNAEPIEVKKLGFDVDVGGTRVSYVRAREFTLEPGEETPLDVMATTRSVDVYRTMLGLRGQGELKYALHGELWRPGLTRRLRFSHNGSYEAPPLP